MIQIMFGDRATGEPSAGGGADMEARGEDGRESLLAPVSARRRGAACGPEAFMVTVRIFLKLSPNTRIGQGKIELLEAIESAGSISAAARKLKMSFRRAWELLDQMNKAFGRPVVTGHAGSAGGSELTELGRDVIRRYRQIEAETLALAAPHLAALDAARAIDEAGGETA
jgi:molybdate transport system regulatory protein